MYDFYSGSQFFKHSLLLMIKNLNILSNRAFKSLAFSFDKIKVKLIQINNNKNIGSFHMPSFETTDLNRLK